MLTLSGTASLANYQTALRSITYVNISDNPSTTTRTISFVVSDGTNYSVAATRNISVTAVNDAPSGTNGTITVTEDTTYTFQLSDFGFTDVDNNALLKVWFDTLPSQGTLKWNGSAFTAGNFVTAYDISIGLLTYVPVANAFGNGVASFTFRVQDDGGTANGGSDTDPSANTISITITAVNDAPTFSSSMMFTGISEDAASNSGMLVSSFNSSISDADSGALKGIAITSVDNTNGTWQYTLDGSNWLAIGNVSLTSARLLPSDATASFRFVPNADWNGSTGLVYYKAWDQTSGTAGGLADVSSGGGSSAFSQYQNGSSLSVSAVNDAPTALSTTATLAAVVEDTVNPPGATVTSLFSSVFSDSKDQVTGGSSANNFAGVAIVSNTANASTEGVWHGITARAGLMSAPLFQHPAH